MGKGVDRGKKRVYQFSLDKESQADLIEWLESQSTRSVAIQGLKLVKAGAGVVTNGSNSDVQNNQIIQLTDRIIQLTDQLNIALTNNSMGMNSLLQQNPQLNQIQQSQIQQGKDEQSVTSESTKEETEVTKPEDEEEEFDEAALAHAEKTAERGFDPADWD